MDCIYGCEDSWVYRSIVDNSFHCMNCSGEWQDVQETTDFDGLYLPDTVRVLDDGSADVDSVQRG